MVDEFVTFKALPDKETAEDFVEVLKAQDIPYLIEEDALVFDPSYANNPLNKEYLVKIRQADFAAAEKAVEDYFSVRLDDVGDDYYLFSFTNEELKDILTKPDEWGKFDYLLAQRLLVQRGVTLTNGEKEVMRIKRFAELAKPETETVSNIAGYYTIAFLFFPIGILIGWTWAYSKKNLPTGERVYTYELGVRKHGQRIFAIAIAMLVLILFSTLFGKFPN